MSSSNGYNSGRGGSGGPMTRTDARLIAQAASQRWGISEELREECLQKLREWLPKCRNIREVGTITRSIQALESQNQADQHHAAKLKADEGPQELIVKVVYESAEADG